MSSTSQKAIINFKDSKSHPPLHVFIKISAKGSEAEFFNKTFHTFETEIGFYEGLCKDLLDWSRDKGVDILSEHIPKYFGTAMVGEDLCMVMEDFIEQGTVVTYITSI